MVPAQTYEITFTGQAGTTLRAEFDDCQVTVGPDTTTLRADLPDQVALCGLVQRITGLGLDIVHLHLITPASAPEPISPARVRRLPQDRLTNPAARIRGNRESLIDPT